MISPQYSEMNSFFEAKSRMKIPQPATSEGAINNRLPMPRWTKTLRQLILVVLY
jgi:hypothetical protein